MSWCEVSAGRDRCPICNHDRRCKVAPDGNGVVCFYITDAPAGWRLKEKHPGGGATFFRDVGPKTTPRTIRRTKPTATPLPKPSPEQIDAAYSRMIEKLELNILHRLDLHRRGLSDEEIDRRQYRSMPNPTSRSTIAASVAEKLGDCFRLIPGFGFDKAGKPTVFGAIGMVIPVRRTDGKIVAIKIRADRPRTGMPKYTYLSSWKRGGNSPGSPCHVPLGVSATSTIRITEGELKSDIAYVASGIPTISFPGVDSWRVVIPALREFNVTTVRAAFDADATTNAAVASKQLECVAALKAEGFTVEMERWSPDDAKGIDDLLIAGKTPEVLIGDVAIAAAAEVAKVVGVKAETVAAPDDQLIRQLEAVIKERGIPGLFQTRDLLQQIAATASIDPPLFAALRTTARELGVPMKDFYDATKQFVKDAAAELQPQLARDESGGFFVHEGCICRMRFSTHGPEVIPLCNFVARIVDETRRDDGASEQIVFGIAGKMHDGRELRRIEVAADKFAKMDWVDAGWGGDATVWPNELRALPAAIKAISRRGQKDVPPKKYRRVFEHTGLRNVNGKWVYLHAGGMIGYDAALDGQMSVDLAPPLDRFRLPEPPVGAELVAAVRASLEMLSVAPYRLTFPLLAAVYRSVLGPSDFSLSLIGTTGFGKTELAALDQQHFGPSMNARNLPAGWSSTVNANEKLLFLAKDAIAVIDDFAPSGSLNEVNRFHRDADRLFRAQGNNIGRGRMRHDGTLRPPTPPRGLIISTGEDFPRGQSIQARQLILEVQKHDVNFEMLTVLQQHAADGLLAASLSAYLAWVLPQYDRFQKNAKDKIAELRAQASSGRQHSRTPGIVAELAYGFFKFLKFAVSVGAISEEERGRLRQQCWDALIVAAQEQRSFQLTSDPAKYFLNLLHSALGTGRIHLANVDTNGQPDNAAAVGWRRTLVNSHDKWQPQGRCVGWTNGKYVYLDRDAALAEMQHFAQDQGLSITISITKLGKALKEHGLLAATDEKRKTLTVRRKIQGQSRNVLLLLRKTLSNSAEDATSLPTADGDHAPNANGHPDCQVRWQANGSHKEANSTSENTEKADELASDVGNGRFGTGVEANSEMEEHLFE